MIPQFIVVSDPYEIPEDPEVMIQVTDRTSEEMAQEAILYLENAGFISGRTCTFMSDLPG